MADRKERFSVISRFESLCKKNEIQHPIINKNVEQWAADALLETFSLSELYSILDYYFQVNPRPTWKSFANNADRVLQSMQDRKADDMFRAEMRQKAKEWLK